MTDLAGALPGQAPARAPYHVGIATCDLDRAMSQFGELFGFAWGPIADGAEPGLADASGPVPWTCRRAHSRGGAFHVELLEGSAGSTWETGDLALVHHVAFWSDDVPGEVDDLVASGWTLELTLRDQGARPSEFAYLTMPGAVRVELVASARRPAYEAAVQP